MFFSLMGYIVLLFSYYDSPYPILYWDIYTFLPVALILSLVFLFLPYGGLLALVLGALTIFSEVVNWNLEFLGGVCTSKYQSSWPLLPWVSYATFFAALGRALREQKSAALIQLQKQVC